MGDDEKGIEFILFLEKGIEFILFLVGRVESMMANILVGRFGSEFCYVESVMLNFN